MKVRISYLSVVPEKRIYQETTTGKKKKKKLSISFFFFFNFCNYYLLIKGQTVLDTQLACMTDIFIEKVT